MTVSAILLACNKENLSTPAAQAAASAGSQLTDSTTDTLSQHDTANIRVTAASNVSVSKQRFVFGETVTVVMPIDSMHYNPYKKINWAMQRVDSLTVDTAGSYKLIVPSGNSRFAYLQIFKKGKYRLTVRSSFKDSGNVVTQKGFATFVVN